MSAGRCAAGRGGVCVCVCVCEEWQSSDGYQPSEVVSNDSGVCVCVSVCVRVCLYTHLCVCLYTHMSGREPCACVYRDVHDVYTRQGITSAIPRMHDLYIYTMAAYALYILYVHNCSTSAFLSVRFNGHSYSTLFWRHTFSKVCSK